MIELPNAVPKTTQIWPNAALVHRLDDYARHDLPDARPALPNPDGGRTSPFWLDDCEIDPVAGSVALPDQPLAFLEPKVMQLLLRLTASPGEPVSRRKLMDAVWPPGAGFDDALTHAISKLRRALGDTNRPPRFIQTLHGRGYRLMIDPRPAAGPDSSVCIRQRRAAAPCTRSLDLRALIADLRRRRVFRVTTAYLVVGWLIVQVGETVFEPLGIPEAGLTALVVAVIIGLPIAVTIAWAVQLTGSGPVLEIPLASRRTIRTPLRSAPQRLLMAAALLLVTGLFSYGVVLTGTDDPGPPNVCMAAQ